MNGSGNGPDLYRRVVQAAERLADLDWITRQHGGNPDKARKAIEDDYFPELGLAFPLHRLLVLHREFPEESQWAEWKYDLTDLWAVYEEKVKGTRPTIVKRRATVKDLEERDEKIKQMEWKEKDAARRIDEKAKEIASLSERLEKRKQEARQYRAEIDQIRRELAERDAIIATLRGKLAG